MSDIHGFTHGNAIKRAPQSIRKEVTADVQKLKELSVKPGKRQRRGNVNTQNELSKQQVIRQALTKRVGVDNTEAESIVKPIGPMSRGVQKKIEKRLDALPTAEIKKLKNLLTKELPNTEMIDPSERMLIRTTLLLAFAHGPSGELKALRELLVGTTPETRQTVYGALSMPNANVTRVLDQFRDGPFKPTENDYDTLRRLAVKDGGIGGPLVKTRVDEYMVKMNIDSTHPKYNEIKVGATAVSAYTSDLYKGMNAEMRERNGTSAPLSKDSALMNKAATHFLSTLPDFKGIVSRGGGSGWQPAALEKYVTGQVVVEPTFVSSSPNKGFGGSIQFLIESRHGKEISDFSVAKKDGREVLFPPGTKFEVLGVHKAKERTSLDNADEWVDNDNNEKTIVIILREVD